MNGILHMLPHFAHSCRFRVFAKRIVSTTPKYNPRKAIFQWKRYAVATIPRLWPLGVNQKILIPWPRLSEKVRLPPGE